MRYLTFSPPNENTFEVCFLVPYLSQTDMERFYVDPHLSGTRAALYAYDLAKGEKRTPVKDQRAYLDELLPILKGLDTRYLVVCDGEYFKTLTKSPSTDNALGYVMPCTIEGFEHMQVLYCPNFKAAYYNPEKCLESIRIALTALKNHQKGLYIPPGKGVIHFEAYPLTVVGIRDWLEKLFHMDCDLSVDIETFSLKHWDAGIGSITFCWSKHEGIAFPVDLLSDPDDRNEVRGYLHAFLVRFWDRNNQRIREARSPRKLLWHNISFDAYVLIYQLFMTDLLDTQGMLEGIRVLLEDTNQWEDTKLITYLTTNSCAGNELGLKIQAQEFAGQYAVEEITNIRALPLDKLLQYNLIDGLSTWYVYDKHWDNMVEDEQEPIYQTLFKPSIVDIVQMQLTGLPLNMERVKLVEQILRDVSNHALQRIQSFQLVQEFVYSQTECAWEADYAARRAKAKNPDKIKIKPWETFPEVPFNPNSNDQLQDLLYDERWLGLPVLDYTKTGNPATGGKTLEKLVNHATTQKAKDFLAALVEFKAVEKMLTAFLPRFLEAPQANDGWHYLYGNFNLGGTVSGRLSSSNPNLQNLPANVFVTLVEEIIERYAEVLKPYIKKGKLALGKFMKSCFEAPKGFLLIGLDFDSLEDRISALTTKDPNKLKVYTDGYNGHCLRAYSYFKEHMPDIDPDCVESINSIEDRYPDLRQMSKPPTFAMTYQGTYLTLMKNCGFDEIMARHVEAQYQELYAVSIQWVDAKLDQASKDGFVTIAFGLRLRTPLLHRSIRKTSRTLREAEAEGRTAGNALGQSWGLLNNRASIAFMGRVRSGEYSLDIRPCAHIHDAQYYLISEDLAVLLYVNEHLVKEVSWQNHPDIAHPDVGLGGEVSVFYPTWADEMTIPNGASEDQIKEIACSHISKL